MPSPPLSSALLSCPVPQSLEATASAPDPPDHCHPRAERQHPLPPEMAESQPNTSVLCGHRAPHRTSYTSDFELCNPTSLCPQLFLPSGQDSVETVALVPCPA